MVLVLHEWEEVEPGGRSQGQCADKCVNQSTNIGLCKKANIYWCREDWWNFKNIYLKCTIAPSQMIFWLGIVNVMNSFDLDVRKTFDCIILTLNQSK